MVMKLKKKINNKVAIVTGAGSGIGKAALGLAREGVDIYLAGRKKRQTTYYKENINKENNEGICHVIKCDVSKETDKKNVYAIQNLWKTDLLFNNAGIRLKANTIDKIEFRDWKKVLILILTACFYVLSMPIINEKTMAKRRKNN